jgi:hypothetical protein
LGGDTDPKMWRFPKMLVPPNHSKLDHFSIDTHDFGEPTKISELPCKKRDIFSKPAI